ncbi:MAG TPA: hypothetical protein VFJ16_19875 [Longimicrobium sp.]|nr:hypothetical protein [Longimicrobium sp.]
MGTRTDQRVGLSLTRLNELAREYEARHYPPTRRLDLQAEGPEGARERALRWIQSFAHEEPGSDLLLIVERLRPGRGKSPVRLSVEKLLNELNGGLIEWWQPFADGSLALRVARDPRRFPAGAKPPPLPGEGRTPETAGAAYLDPAADIPPELRPIALRAAELRRSREGLAVSAAPVVLRGIWNDAQARAFDEGVSWEQALAEVLEAEQQALYEDE